MDFNRKWTQFALDAEVASFGTDRICKDHNKAVEDAATKINQLRAENAALKYSLQLDEELIGMIQKIISVLNSRPVQTPNPADEAWCDDCHAYTHKRGNPCFVELPNV